MPSRQVRGHDEKIIGQTYLGEREITLTNTHLTITDGNGHRNVTISEPTVNITGYGSTIKRNSEELYYSIFSIVVGIMCLLLVQLLRSTGLGGWLADAGASSTIPGSDIIAVVFTALLAGVSIIGVGLIVGTITGFALTAWYLSQYFDSSKQYIVIKRDHRSDYEIEAPNKEEAAKVSTQLDQWREQSNN